MKKKLTSAKEFVQRHRVGLTAAGTTLACTYVGGVLLLAATEEANAKDEFLKEKGLYEEFYASKQSEGEAQ